jgi:integral membrane protein
VTPKRLFRSLAIAEAITWTLLITGMILKYGAGIDVAVTIGGGIHGFVFLAYAFTVLLVGVNQRWSLALIALGVVTAVVPYATIPFEIVMARKGRLEGAWRHEASAHPSDRNVVNRMLRWFLARPVLLTVVAVIGVAAVFAALLVIGPPGGEKA